MVYWLVHSPGDQNVPGSTSQPGGICSDRPATGLIQPQRTDTWGFPRKIKAARTGAGISTSNAVVA